MAETHVISALRAKRAEVSGYIHDLEKKVKTWRARLAHIDATIKIFSPETDPEAIPPRRTYRRSGYFTKGEMARLCLDELRKADGQPITTATIVAGLIKAKGLPDDPALAENLTERVLSYLRVKRKAGGIIKSGTSPVLWRKRHKILDGLPLIHFKVLTPATGALCAGARSSEDAPTYRKDNGAPTNL